MTRGGVVAEICSTSRSTSCRLHLYCHGRPRNSVYYLDFSCFTFEDCSPCPLHPSQRRVRSSNAIIQEHYRTPLPLLLPPALVWPLVRLRHAVCCPSLSIRRRTERKLWARSRLAAGHALLGLHPKQHRQDNLGNNIHVVRKLTPMRARACAYTVQFTIDGEWDASVIHRKPAGCITTLLQAVPWSRERRRRDPLKETFFEKRFSKDKISNPGEQLTESAPPIS